MDIVSARTDVGVLIGRFQVPSLHEGHEMLIQEVLKRHKKVLILLGVSQAKNTRMNPLDFMTRKLMIQEQFPDVPVIPIKDVMDDWAWSASVDDKIREVYDLESVTIYGSRDGFIPYYHGKFPVIELEATVTASGTHLRDLASKEVRSSEDFRIGAIYSSFNKYPITHPTVDAAIIKNPAWDYQSGQEIPSEKNTGEQILLVRKNTDTKNRWRFVGGFVDANKDSSLERAVTREVSEEVGMPAIGKPKYIGSAKIDDWRYRNEKDGILTSFFYVPFLWGAVKAQDDVNEVKWFSLKSLLDNGENILVDTHFPLLTLLREYLNWTPKESKNEEPTVIDG